MKRERAVMRKDGRRPACGGVDDETRRCNNESSSLPPANHQGDKDDLYTELWHACAGPLIYVPNVGERIFYFPQGHIEQVKAQTGTNQDDCMDMPPYNLPSKILCKVVNVELKAEVGTDEVFAQITLLPEGELDDLSPRKEANSPQLPRKTTSVRSFSKKLTASDTSTHGGFSVPKRHADDCLPPLDMSQQPPAQELMAKDLHGSQWRFRHIYRGQPKRHLLTSGWSTFVGSKSLVAGDAFIFLQGENGELRAGIRRATKPQSNTSTTVISANSIQHGVLASAFHAISTGTVFTVFYRPWTSPAEFIVPFDRYMKSADIDYSIGMRFRMLFEGEECTEQRIDKVEGTIVGLEDVDHVRWPDSEWRILQVTWDSTPEDLVYPERVSPWNIEPMEPVKRKCASILHGPKRIRPLQTTFPGLPGVTKNGLMHGRVNYGRQSQSEVLQGQENRDPSHNGFSAVKRPLTPHWMSLANPAWNHTSFRPENQLHLPMHDPPLYRRPSGAVSFPGGNIARLGPPNGWCYALGSYGIHENSAGSRNLPVSNVNSRNSVSKDRRGSEWKDPKKASLAPPDGGGRYMLFGVNLVNCSPPELPSPQVATSTELESHYFVPPTSQSSVSESSKTKPDKNSEKRCKYCCRTTIRSCTKVLKYGTSVRRSVDFTRFNGYDELIRELDQMFDFKGSLTDGSSGWHVTYKDDEGDMMLIEESCSWQEFQSTVRKLFIYPMEEIDKLNPSSPSPIPK
ncbi:hypothetical protein Tsubulata_025572 [Turnera subulata]|uniref:Auxin response factor n=1 Tax=Turnera subulata TaxID=218843 RepID=A0A9Q0GA21_9ROSI|nr:hypothetical protein Tsubulata_025572 [Turnera subulata]